jgi:hypothetical protein
MLDLESAQEVAEQNQRRDCTPIVIPGASCGTDTNQRRKVADLRAFMTLTVPSSTRISSSMVRRHIFAIKTMF